MSVNFKITFLYIFLCSVAYSSNSSPIARQYHDSFSDNPVSTGYNVNLDGTGSTDPDFDDLSYAWTLVSKPNGSNAELSNTSVPKPTFTADVEGQYEVWLVVNDGFVDSSPYKATITALKTHLVSTTQELRSALMATATNGVGDAIVLAPGIYSTSDDGQGSFKYLSNEHNTLLLEGSDAQTTILNGNSENRILSHQSTELTKPLVIRNLSFIGGFSTGSVDHGGAIYTEDSVEIYNSVFTNNHSEGYGGAIGRASSVKIENCIFDRNSSRYVELVPNEGIFGRGIFDGQEY